MGEEGPSYLKTGTAYGLFYGSLAAVVITAIAAPYLLKSVKNYLKPTEEFVSARNTQPWWSITCSFFSSSLGCWVLTAPAEIAQTYSNWGIIGYALATSLPWMGVAYFGPRMRRLTNNSGLSNVDFVYLRLGQFNHTIYSLLAFGSVFLAYIVECVSLSRILSSLAPRLNTSLLISSVAIGVFIYTSVSGLQASLITDRFQLCAITILIVLASVGVFKYSKIALVDELSASVVESSIRSRNFWSGDGFVSLIVLNVSCLFPTFIDPASWSRIYAARSEHDAKRGLLVAAAFLFIPMILFGYMGLISGAAYDLGATEDTSVFATLTLLRPWWSGLVIILATLLSTSTVDTYTTSLTTFSMSLAKAFYPRMDVNYARVVSLGLTILGVVLIIHNPPTVMTIFMCCNLLSTCTAGGLLLALWSFVTPIGVTSGIFSAALSVCTVGWIRNKTFKAGFEWWLLPEGSANTIALITFLLCGSTALLVTIGVSQLEFLIRPEQREEQVRVLAELAMGAQQEDSKNTSERGSEGVSLEKSPQTRLDNTKSFNSRARSSTQLQNSEASQLDFIHNIL